MENNTQTQNEIQLYLTHKIFDRIEEEDFSVSFDERLSRFIHTVRSHSRLFLCEHAGSKFNRVLNQNRWNKQLDYKSDQSIDLVYMICTLLSILSISQDPEVAEEIPGFVTNITCDLAEEVFASASRF